MRTFLKEATKKHIESLGDFVLKGGGVSIPNTNNSNLQEYNRLVQNVFKDNLKSAFPLTYNLLSSEEWKFLLEDFIQNHKCKSHQIWKMPFEFFQYFASKKDFKLAEKYPFIIELFYLEWLEIELYMMEDEPQPAYESNGDYDKNYLVPNPEVKIVALSFPVHLKKAKLIEEKDKGQFFLSIHRNPINYKVIFTDLAAVFVEIISYIHEHERPMYSDLVTILKTKNISDEIAQASTQSFLDEAIKSKLILGYGIR